MELVHALAPPLIGFLFTCLSFLDEHLIISKVERYLQGKISAQQRETTVLLVRGAMALVTFLANSLIFIANLLLAFLIYPIHSGAWIIVVGVVDLLLIAGVVYQVLWLFGTHDVIEIAELVPWRRTTWTIDKWLRIEQILFTVFTISFFTVGFYLPHKENMRKETEVIRSIPVE